MLCKPLFENLLNDCFMRMYTPMLVCLSKPLIVKLWHSVCMSMRVCVCVCVCVRVCACFVESVHGLNECMC